MKQFSSGGYGKLFKKNCKKRNKTIVLKQISDFKNLNEPLLMKMLSDNPYICDSYSFHLNSKNLIIKMPLYSGTFRELMARTLEKNTPVLEKMFSYWKDVAMGLDALHSIGVFHRDLKPENIFYDSENDRCVLGDFGMIAVSGARYQSKQMCTITYRAPEICAEIKYGPKSDIWSLALTFGITWTKDLRDCFDRVETIQELLMNFIDFNNNYHYKRNIIGYIIHLGGGQDLKRNQYPLNCPDIKILDFKKMINMLLFDMLHINPDQRLEIKQVIKRIEQMMKVKK